MIVYRLNNKWDMVKFLDLQAITMRHGGEIKAAIDRVVESGWFLQEMKINGLRWTMQNISVQSFV